jgi:hypothetical protein
MSKTPLYNQKVKEILDALEPGERTCKATGEVWNMDQTEIDWYKKFMMPPSQISPLTRLKKLCTNFTNFQWWWHKHPETGEPVLSAYNPNSGTKVLPDLEWVQKEFSEINQDYDPAKSFFDQYRKLQVRVPVKATRNFIEPENSISLVSFGDQNSYFTLACKSKGLIFGLDAFDAENSVLSAYTHHVTDCYSTLQSNRIHSSKFIRSSYDCINCYFLFDCRNCEFCFGASNKRNKKYLWFNEQLTQSEWEKRFAEVDLGQRDQLEKYQKMFMDLMSDQTVWPESFSEKTENSTGEYLQDCVDVKDGWFLSDCRNLHNSFVSLKNAEDCYTIGGAIGSTNCYQIAGCMNCDRTHYSLLCGESQSCEYCMSCYNCENCFGCIGLQRKKFHIFNKEYSEEEYWQRVDELKCAMLDQGEYGEYFPTSFCGGYYYESGAVPIYGCGEKQAKQLGAAEYDPNANGASGFAEFDPETGKTVDDIPDSIDDFKVEDWAGKPIYDPEKDRQFAFLKPEIEWYHKYRIAPPKKHFITGLLSMQQEMNTAVFEDSTCYNCQVKIRVGKNMTYTERKMYCKKCYLEYLEKHG